MKDLNNSLKRVESDVQIGKTVNSMFPPPKTTREYLKAMLGKRPIFAAGVPRGYWRT